MSGDLITNNMYKSMNGQYLYNDLSVNLTSEDVLCLEERRFLHWHRWGSLLLCSEIWNSLPQDVWMVDSLKVLNWAWFLEFFNHVVEAWITLHWSGENMFPSNIDANEKFLMVVFCFIE